MIVKRMSKNWFFIGIGLMILTAFQAPAVGLFIKQYSILKVGIFLAFLITGLTLETSSIVDQLRHFRVLAAALISSLFVIPALAYGMASVCFPTAPDFIIGACIIGAAPVTVASGTVMTTIALGNVPLSLFICVLCNFGAILTIPFILNLILQFGQDPISLPILKMLTGLTITVLLPTVIGQLIRPFVRDALPPFKKAFSVFNQCIVLLIILNAVSSSASKIAEAGFVIVYVFLFMISLHFIILIMNFGISKLIGLDAPSTAAFTIHASQKTLTVSYLVWAGWFAAAYPMALIPGIAYHLTQMIVDTFVAQLFRSSALRREAIEAGG